MCAKGGGRVLSPRALRSIVHSSLKVFIVVVVVVIAIASVNVALDVVVAVAVLAAAAVVLQTKALCDPFKYTKMCLK